MGQSRMESQCHNVIVVYKMPQKTKDKFLAEFKALFQEESLNELKILNCLDIDRYSGFFYF